MKTESAWVGEYPESDFCDEDYSGVDSLRSDFNRMIEAAKAKKFQIILCKSQSRMVCDLKRRERPDQQSDLMERMRELLKLETIPRELVVGLIDRIEIGEKHPETGRQEVKVFWRF